MNDYLNLFKALPVFQRSKSFTARYMEYGVLVEDSVVECYGNNETLRFIKQLVPSDSQINQTFHKSWRKVRDASIEQLLAEQVMHYFSTYGLQSAGLYNEETVFIPNEELNLEGKGGITFYTLRGITSEEVADRVQRLISSGVALSDSDLNSLVNVVRDQQLLIDPSTSSNREMSVRLYDLLGITPKDPTEYLRLQVYRKTGSSMLIKSKDVLESISTNSGGEDVFAEYERTHGLSGLASVFYRFKPLFLAFKNPKFPALKNPKLCNTVNRIRKLAVKHHRPMPEDYLASVTKHLRNGTLDVEKLRTSLAKANVFRKIKLAQALRFYGDSSASGVVYSIRNGKSFATTINPIEGGTDEASLVVMESLSEDLSHLKDKRVLMDVGLATPTSGKMFCGDVPFGSHFTTESSLAVGVSWKDAHNKPVDLDLSFTSVGGKIGWNATWRSDDTLFSGDVTSAPNGATEALLVREQAGDGLYLVNLNYYNGHGDGDEVPFTVFVTEEDEYQRMERNSVMVQDHMLFWADSSINGKHRQKIIGVLEIKYGVKTFYVFESKTGSSAASRNDHKSVNTIAYYDKYLDSILDLRSLLEWAGAKVISPYNSEPADVDLSMHSLTKDALVNLLTEQT